MPECRNCGKPTETGDLCPECAAAEMSPFGAAAFEAQPTAEIPQPTQPQPVAEAQPSPKKKTNPAGIIALLVLLLAFAGATAYIALAFSGILE